MAQPRRGRPLNPLDPDASCAARLGAELRACRLARDLTLAELGALTDYTPQYTSEVERAKAAPSRPFIQACDDALQARGALMILLPAAVHERVERQQERAAARRAARDPASLPCEPHSDAGEHVEPTNRRDLIGAGGAAALGLSTAAAPAAAREIDPELPAHWERLLDVLSRHGALRGYGTVLDAVRHELRLIAEHRRAARGELRTQLMRVEARWSAAAAFMSGDVGRLRDRDALTERALWLAREADWADMVAIACMRRSQWATQRHDARRAVAHADAALRIPGTSAQTRATCAMTSAISRALAHDVEACERHVADAYALVEHSESPPPWVGDFRVGIPTIRASEARCWLLMDPSKAIGLYEDALRDWPRDNVRDGGLHQARLALACAGAGEHDRARAEGRKALAIMRTTKSSRALDELRRLGLALGATD